MRQASEALGDPQVVILSAGIAVPGHFAAMPIEVFEQSMRVNYFGSLHCAHAALPYLRKVKHSSLVFISSGAGLLGIFGYASYAPTKFAVRGLAEVLRAELAPHDIHVCIAYPPDTDTPQYKKENETKPPQTKAITASAGLWSADDVANAIIKGIDARKYSIAIGLELRLLARLQSILAPAINWWFDRLAAKAEKSG